MGINVLRIIDIPVMPPADSFAGVTNMEMPSEYIIQPSKIMAYCLSTPSAIFFFELILSSTGYIINFYGLCVNYRPPFSLLFRREDI